MTKLLNTVATRIQTRLSRKALKVALGDIKDYLKANAGNIENITDVEVNQATEYFMNNSTKLTVFPQDAAPITTEVEETFSSVDAENGNIATSTQIELETLETEQETTEVDNGIQLVNSNLDTNLDDIDSQDLHPTTSDQPTENLPQSQHQVDRTGWYQPAPLATTEKSELVSSTAQSLGIALSTQEVETIATNINTASEDLTDSLEEIKGAIIAFISYKANLNSQKIDDTLTEISQVAATKFNENSEQFTDGLRQINQQMQQQRTDFKSKVKATLSAFAIPAIKAG
ncbi:hypothetical protein [Anabaena azotica]|uniref:hypothetical protein n=1 Tax=Anabaena azotica TaxID=197653 RepID=UPI0039A6BE27